MRIFLTFLFIFSSSLAFAQSDSTDVRQLDLIGDFRFRVEHDWNSQNANGDLRQDRSRLRYRFRFGAKYQVDKSSSIGMRIRSGNINDQQGPHLTLGGGNGEFGLSQIGFEKWYYQYEGHGLKAWIGKNDILLRKVNELFWNDNVFPEGAAVQYSLPKKEGTLYNQLGINLGHYIIQSRGGGFGSDAFLQTAQLDFSLLNERLHLFPGFNYFRHVGNIPDRQHTFLLDYRILHLGAELMISKKTNLRLAAELYSNIQDYSNLDEIPTSFKDQKDGFVITAKYGKLKEKGDFIIDFYYAYLEKYSIVDYFAQNDWARWDYSSLNAAGARLSNFSGFEIRVGYNIKKNFNLVFRGYQIEQLLAEGTAKENGSRVRLDLNIKF